MTDFKAKMHLIRFRLRLRPRPRWGSLQHSPRPLSGFWGRFAAGGVAGLGKRRERGGRVKWRRGKGSCPQVTVEPGPLTALLRHCAVVHSSQNCVVRSSGTGGGRGFYSNGFWSLAHFHMAEMSLMSPVSLGFSRPRIMRCFITDTNSLLLSSPSSANKR